MTILALAEKTWALCQRELRLLRRSRGRLICTAMVPLVGGVVSGQASSTLPAAYSLFAFLPLCTILFAVGSRASGGDVVIALSAITSPTLRWVSWLLAALPVVVAQAALLAASAGILGGFDVELGTVALAVSVSLAVGSVAHRSLVPG